MTIFPAWQPRFLTALAKTGNVLLAAQSVHLTRQNAYLARSTRNRTGPARLQALAFAQCWELALKESSVPLEMEFRQRALHGQERQKPVFYKGKQVGLQKWTVYNDTLLITLLKATLPEKYGSLGTRAKSKASTDSDPDPADLLSLSPEQFAEREAIENLTDELWCQVLDLLDPASKDIPQPAPEPEIYPQPSVSSAAEPVSPSTSTVSTTFQTPRLSTFSFSLPVSSPIGYQEPGQMPTLPFQAPATNSIPSRGAACCAPSSPLTSVNQSLTFPQPVFSSSQVSSSFAPNLAQLPITNYTLASLLSDALLPTPIPSPPSPFHRLFPPKNPNLNLS